MKRAIVTLALLALSGPAFAKDATCFTSDDGEYSCAFKVLDEAGSFKISAEGKPTFEVWMDAPGQAFVGAVFEPGGRSVALPGTYFRSEDDGACWVSDATETEICAW
jgi:hypothetical protein